MRFGVSYSIFNGEEHLIHSIRSIRDSVDYINICIQYTSNFGERASDELFDTIREIKQQGLVEEIIEYSAAEISPQKNEFNKRSIGLDRARAKDVNYFLTIDADEYYQAEFLNEAKKFIINNDLTHTAVHSYLHIKRPIYRSNAPDNTNICFFSKLYGSNSLVYNGDFPANVDPTRRIIGENGRFYFFNESDVSMSHMNLVRLDNLKSKLKNTPSRRNPKFIRAVAEAYEQWSFGKTLNFPNKPPIEIIEVDDIFAIDHLFTEKRCSTAHKTINYQIGSKATVA